LKKVSINQKCDLCHEATVTNLHVVLKELRLCQACSQKHKDDQTTEKCEDCGEEALGCRCEDYTLKDAYDDLNDIHDLLMCLFVTASHPGIHQFEGKPHLTLINLIGNRVHSVAENLKDIYE